MAESLAGTTTPAAGRSYASMTELARAESERLCQTWGPSGIPNAQLAEPTQLQILQAILDCLLRLEASTTAEQAVVRNEVGKAWRE